MPPAAAVFAGAVAGAAPALAAAIAKTATARTVFMLMLLRDLQREEERAVPRTSRHRLREMLGALARGVPHARNLSDKYCIVVDDHRLCPCCNGEQPSMRLRRTIPPA